jgi:hypothetical protein
VADAVAIAILQDLLASIPGDLGRQHILEAYEALSGVEGTRRGTVTHTVNKLVHGYDAAFWYESYDLLRKALEEHLPSFIRDDDVAEEAIYIEAIRLAGKQVGCADAAAQRSERVEAGEA